MPNTDAEMPNCGPLGRWTPIYCAVHSGSRSDRFWPSFGPFGTGCQTNTAAAAAGAQSSKATATTHGTDVRAA
jgi:hypothetical protein